MATSCGFARAGLPNQHLRTTSVDNPGRVKHQPARARCQHRKHYAKKIVNVFICVRVAYPNISPLFLDMSRKPRRLKKDILAMEKRRFVILIRFGVRENFYLDRIL
jgi:hypothetical protein